MVSLVRGSKLEGSALTVLFSVCVSGCAAIVPNVDPPFP